MEEGSTGYAKVKPEEEIMRYRVLARCQHLTCDPAGRPRSKATGETECFRPIYGITGREDDDFAGQYCPSELDPWSCSQS
ncbi:hypothetical protein GGI42DRAFT_185253 [Trichoderma sp. SZMC 28013]